MVVVQVFDRAEHTVAGFVECQSFEDACAVLAGLLEYIDVNRFIVKVMKEGDD